MSKKTPNTYDVICEALRLAPVHEYPSKLAHILQAEGKTADPVSYTHLTLPTNREV